MDEPLSEETGCFNSLISVRQVFEIDFTSRNSFSFSDYLFKLRFIHLRVAGSKKRKKGRIRLFAVSKKAKFSKIKKDPIKAKFS